MTKATLPDITACWWPCGVWGSGRTLHRVGTGQWQLRQRDLPLLPVGGIQALWRCPWWLTLRLSHNHQAQSCEITIWRHRVDDAQWRCLCVFAANERVFAHRRSGRPS